MRMWRNVSAANYVMVGKPPLMQRIPRYPVRLAVTLWEVAQRKDLPTHHAQTGRKKTLPYSIVVLEIVL